MPDRRETPPGAAQQRRAIIVESKIAALIDFD